MEEFVIYLGNYRYAGEPHAGIHGYGIEKLPAAKIFPTAALAEQFADRFIGRRSFPSICSVISKPHPEKIMPF